MRTFLTTLALLSVLYCDGFITTIAPQQVMATRSTPTTQALPLVSPTQIFLSNNNSGNDDVKPYKIPDGTGTRGQVLLAIALLLNVWMFSLPPSFRRQNICTEEGYEKVVIKGGAQQGDDNYCITTEMWKDSIVEYYKNGGGVVFDLSIDPKTLERNKAIWDATFGEK